MATNTVTSTIDAAPFRRFALMNESRTALQPFRLAAKSKRLLRRARRPTSVIVLPGFGANDLSTIPLRWYLQRIGHEVEGWELGLHGPRVMDTLAQFTIRLAGAATEAGGPVTLVGWSLGGVIAREAARDRPDLVEQVITLGSPIGGARHTSAPWVYDELGHQYLDRINTTRRRRPIQVPVTTIYSRRDGVVDWRHAIDDHTPTAVNVEVNSSHLGLGVDPDVWRTVADAMDAYDNGSTTLEKMTP